jgi:hypothetical protein
VDQERHRPLFGLSSLFEPRRLDDPALDPDPVGTVEVDLFALAQGGLVVREDGGGGREVGDLVRFGVWGGKVEEEGFGRGRKGGGGIGYGQRFRVGRRDELRSGGGVRKGKRERVGSRFDEGVEGDGEGEELVSTAGWSRKEEGGRVREPLHA